jgi:translocation and assembly module TamB
VRVDAFGLQGRVEGRLEVTDLPGKPVTGEGTLSIADGTFSVYGRELAIKTGRLLYSGNPLDNPGVEVRAEKSTGEVTTGIQVSGFLSEPEISFYSIPPMEENAIISRLLLNTSLGSAAGQDQGLLGRTAEKAGLGPVTDTVRGIRESLRLDEVKIETGDKDELSLVVGTWLTPDLYISYGKNMLQNTGSFNTRYLLGRGFSIQTESGATQSGADIKYEIDR